MSKGVNQDSETRAPIRLPRDVTESLTVKFWGTRGSIPTPSRVTEKYGGNTTCMEVRHKETLIVFDAGSGIRELSDSWAAEFPGTTVEATLLFTHLHWDHIQGFPFFSAAYQPGNTFHIYGQERPDDGVEGWLSGQMRGAYFPVPISAMRANLEFRTAPREFTIDEIQVSTFPLPHPGGCLGYRLEVGDAVFVMATDCELDQVALNKDQVTMDPKVRRQYEPELIEFFTGANLVYIDCQYTDDDYRFRKGWGHNPLGTVIDLCAQVRPDMLALSHHDPQSPDHKVAAMVRDGVARLRQRGVEGILLFAAREGLSLRVGKPLPPPSLPF